MAVDGWLVDAHQLYRMLDDLDLNNKDFNKALRAAFNKSSRLIKVEAAKNLKQVSYKGGTIRSADFLSKAINILVYKSGRGATVGLFDNRKSTIKYKGIAYTNPAYVLRWINSGTDVRTIKGRGKYPAGTNRGSMPERPFFATAVQSKYSEAQDALEDNIQKEIIKIANKKRK